MTPLYLFALYELLSASAAPARPVFDAYPAYYASLPGAVFQAEDRRSFRTDWIVGQGTRRLWRGALGGTEKSIEVTGRTVRIGGHHFDFAKAKRFPGEFPAALGNSAELYLNQSMMCIESVAASASGSAARHAQVYLITRPFSAVAALYQLPSLFGSCTGVRLNERGKILFDRVTYRYAAGQDAAIGVIFHEFRLDGGVFVDNHKQVSARFLDPENVYKFAVEP